MRAKTQKQLDMAESLIKKGDSHWAEKVSKKFGTTRQNTHGLVRRYLGGEHPTQHQNRHPLSREAKKALTQIKREFQHGTRDWAETVAFKTGLTESQVRYLAVNHLPEEYADFKKNGRLRRHSRLIRDWNKGWDTHRLAEKYGMTAQEVSSLAAQLRIAYGEEVVHSRR